MRSKRFAIDPFGGDIVFAIYLADLVNRQNIWVIKSGGGFGFLFETGKFVPVLTKFFGEELDRNLAVEPCVLGQIYLAHTAGPDLGNDAVMRKFGVGLKLRVHEQVVGCCKDKE